MKVRIKFSKEGPMKFVGHLDTMRNFQKALLNVLLTPNETLKQLQDEGRMTELMVKQEEIKTLPFGDVWAEYCEECGAPKDGTWFGEIEKYEETVLTKRV